MVDEPREGDRSIERLLRQSRRTSQGVDGAVATDSCLDAETVAAWADDGLTGEALELAQSHVADCERCQLLVGTLARIHAPVAPPEPMPVSRGWLGWLVPIAAGAVAVTAVAVWVAVPRKTAGLPMPAAPAVGLPAQSAPAAALNDQATTFAPDGAAGSAAGNASPAATGFAAAPGGAAVGGLDKDKKEQSPAIAPSLARAPQEARDALRERAKADAAPELRRDAGRLESQNAPPAAAQAASTVSASAAQTTDKAAAAAPPPARFAPSGATVEIVSPDSSVRWRITGSIVTRSTNGGSRWETAPTGNSADLTAGAAPSASVCWIVGRAGVVLLSTDGVRWRRVPFPEAVDLASVRATDASHASVSTVDGRTFATSDAGATWIR